jgi:hypothetical protein
MKQKTKKQKRGLSTKTTTHHQVDGTRMAHVDRRHQIGRQCCKTKLRVAIVDGSVHRAVRRVVACKREGRERERERKRKRKRERERDRERETERERDVQAVTDALIPVGE